MTMISDLPQDLTEEILSRVPITCRGRVRSTCKRWNELFNDQSFTKKHCAKAAEELLVIVVNHTKSCLMNFNLQNRNVLVKSSRKETGSFSSQVEKSRVFHCSGLLLCESCDPGYKAKPLVVWNPYLGQIRWIQPIKKFYSFFRFTMGCDNNNNYKILRYGYEYHNTNLIVGYEIYDFKSRSWRVLQGTPKEYISYHSSRCISLKGNTYFLGLKNHLLCFDFTKERFGPRMHLPFHSCTGDYIFLSTIRQEHLAVLLQQTTYTYETEIWMTSKIEPDAVSWRIFLKVDKKPSMGRLNFRCGTFLVDEKKKVAVICENNWLNYHEAHVIGEDGYNKVVLEPGPGAFIEWPNACSYAPSSVRIE